MLAFVAAHVGYSQVDLQRGSIVEWDAVSRLFTLADMPRGFSRGPREV